MKKLGGLDASFLYAETPQTPMHVAGFSLVEPPGVSAEAFFEAYKRHIGSRLHLVPVLHKKLVQVPWDIDHPVWVDDDALELDYHVRHLGLPKPGTMRQLEELIGRLHSNFLDRSRPLWEFYVIDGLADGRLAIYTKIHHAAVDGGAGMALTQMMYDTTPEPRKVEPPPKATGGAPPDPLRLLEGALRNVVAQQADQLSKLPDLLRAVAGIVTPVIGPRSIEYKGVPTTPLVAPKTMFNGSITSQRSFTSLSVPLAAAKAITKQTGCKLNDVVMCACAGAVRRYLMEKHALPDKPLIAFVPVSLREAGNTESNNQVSGILCSLATDIADPLKRLDAIRESSGQAKEFSSRTRSVQPRDFALFGAPMLIQGAIGLWSRALADRLPPSANLVISNVPGPQQPLYVAGAKVLTLYPVSIPAHGMALNITVQSYNGALDFGLTACRRSVPDLARIADYIEQSLHELHEAALGVDLASAQIPSAEPRAKTPAKTPAKRVGAKATAKAAAKPALRSRRATPVTAKVT